MFKHFYVEKDCSALVDILFLVEYNDEAADMAFDILSGPNANTVQWVDMEHLFGNLSSVISESYGKVFKIAWVKNNGLILD